MRRVAVTGVGLVTPLVCGTDASWSKLIEGQSGLGAITNFDVSDIPSKIAGQVPRSDEDNASDRNLFNPDEWVPRKIQRRMDTFIQYGMAAAEYAVKDAGWAPEDEGSLLRTGVMIGSGIGGLPEIEKSAQVVAEGKVRRLSPFFIPASLINLVSGHHDILL